MIGNTTSPAPAPELDRVRWFNGPPLSLAALRGRVVLIEAFQMLCPGCVTQGLPQAQRVAALFDPNDVVVIGLHTVFEHHDVMRPEALEVFLAEYRISFSVGVDRHEPGDPTPLTMARYALRGTPSTLLIDRSGLLRFHAFGAVDDLVLGDAIGRLITTAPMARPTDPVLAAACELDGTCQTPQAKAP